MAIKRYLLDRCVLRPTRHSIDTGELIQCFIPLTQPPKNAYRSRQNRDTVLETFVAANLDPASGPVSSRATELDRDWRPIAPPRTLLIKFPGTAGRAERSTSFPANLLPEYRDISTSKPGEHYEAWTWNPPGYGGSSGRATLQNLFPAAKDFAEQILARRCGSHTRVWICGNSLGCLPALAFAEQLNDPAVSDRFGLWLRNPPDLAEVVLQVADRYSSRFWMRRVVGKLPPSLDVIQAASRCRFPAVFLMSEHDLLVPPPLQQRVHQSYAGAHRVITLSDLGHGDPITDRHRDEIQSAVQWLADQTTPR